jgi:hypothetical protein
VKAKIISPNHQSVQKVTSKTKTKLLSNKLPSDFHESVSPSMIHFKNRYRTFKLKEREEEKQFDNHWTLPCLS